MNAIPDHSEHARIVAQHIADKLRTLPWTRCPSTHCERSGECRSPHECSGSGAGLVKREVYAAIMRERGEGENVAQMLIQRDKEATTLADELDARTEERDALESLMAEICELLGCDDCDDAPGAVRALTAERDALRAKLQTACEALERLAVLTPSAANARTPTDLWLSCKAIAETALATINEESQP